MHSDHKQPWREAYGGDRSEGADALWELLGELDDAEVGASDVDVDNAWARVSATLQTATKPVARVRRLPRAVRYAAAVAAAILVLVGVNILSGGDSDAERFVNNGALPERIELLDRTSVGLDPGASILFSIDEASRTASLLGSADFDVSSDPSRPFRVEAPGFEIVVVGTEFRIDASDTRARVSVREGHVRLRGTREADWINLYAGDQATVSDQLATRDTIAGTPFDRGLHFDSATVSAIQDVLRSEVGLTLRVAPHLRTCAVTANFEGSSPEEIVLSLATLFDAELLHEGDVYTLEGGSCR